ncbi:MAG: macrolide ABC transporter ATP-binding protein/permease [bacterium]|nr:macrolide ABC transporter ATP-binding protein/permease [bacterium]
MIKIEHLTKVYRDENKKVIDDISFELPDKGLFFILGKSGSGKTTLLNLLAGIDQPTEGVIRYDEMEIENFTEKEIDELRNKKMGIIFQDFNLISTLTVFQNVKLALSIQNWQGKSEADITERVMKALQYVGMEALANRRIQQLSGGEIQRVSIARVLVKNPQFILADEPTGNLDSKNSTIIFEILKKISSKCLVVAVTHDRESAIKYGDGYYEIVDGHVVKTETAGHSTIISSFDIEVRNKENRIERSVELTKQNALSMFEHLLGKIDEWENNLHIDISRKDTMIASKDKKEEEFEDRKNIECTRMSKLDLISYAVQNISRRKVKMMITIVMMVLTFTLLLLTSFMTRYDKYQVLENYFEEYQPNYLYPMKEVTYTDSLKQFQSKELTSGKEIYQILSTNIDKNMGGLMSDILVKREADDLYYQESGMYVYDGMLEGYRLNGSLPVLSNEVVITDYLANILQLSGDAIGTKIEVDGIEATITGILCTDYVEYGIESKLNQGTMDSYAQYLYEYRYNIVLVNTTFFKNMEEKSKYIYTACTDVLNSEKENYYTSEITIGDLDLIKNERLLVGRMPEKENEIIISKSYASENEYLNEDGSIAKELLTQRFSFKNIRSVEFAEYYTDRINLYEFFTEGVEVVGIYEDEGYSDVSSPKIYIMSQSFSEIKEEYYNYYIYNQYFISGNAKEYHKIINLARRNEWSFKDLVAYKIQEFDSMVSYFSNALSWILIVLICIVILMIYSNVSGSIDNNKKMIGILRTLGVNRKDTVNIFAVEALIIYLCSIILSIIGSFCVIQIINYLYRKGSVECPFNICYYNPYLTFEVSLFCFIMFSLSALIPIRRFSKQHPMQVIRSE